MSAIGDALRALAAAVDEHMAAQSAVPRAPDADDRVGAAEAARLGLGAKAYRRACRDGRLPAERAGRAYVVRRADLDSYCAGRRVVPRASTTAPTIREAVLAEIARGRLRTIPGGRGK